MDANVISYTKLAKHQSLRWEIVKKRNSNAERIIVGTLNFRFQFLSDVLAPMFAKHGLTTMLLKEFSRRPCSLSPVRSNTSGESVYCVHYSSALKHVIVHKYSPCSNSWTEVTSISCVSECVRFVYSKGKLITIADQGHIRVVESYDLSDSFARTVHTQTMPWRAGFRPIAVGDYVYMLAGIGWHSDPTEHLSNGSFLRCVWKNYIRLGCVLLQSLFLSQLVHGIWEENRMQLANVPILVGSTVSLLDGIAEWANIRCWRRRRSHLFRSIPLLWY